MAKLVTSDGVQVNLFLDLDSHNTGEGTLLYGPKSQPEMDFIVKGFRNFKTNTEFNNKNRLEFHSDAEIQVNISTLISSNPTSSNQYTVPNHSNTKLYFVGNDLVLSKTGTKIHRIDLFKSASTNIDDLEDSMFDGDYNSLTNKPTIPSDVNDLSDADGLLSSGGGAENPNITAVQYQNGPEIAFLADGAMYMGSSSTSSYWSGERYVTTFFTGNETFENIRKVPIPDPSPIKQMGVFAASAFALTESGNLYTWGYNVNGQLGLGHNNSVEYPTISATDVVEFFGPESNFGNNVGTSNYYDRIFIKKTDGKIYGTGYNGTGGLGLGNTTSVNQWTLISSLGTNQVQRLFALGGYNGFTVVQKTDLSIWVTGANASGQLGIGNTTNQTSFVDASFEWRSSSINTYLDGVKAIAGASGSVGSSYETTCYMYFVNLGNSGVTLNASGYNGKNNIRPWYSSSHVNDNVSTSTNYLYPRLVWSEPSNIPNDTIEEIFPIGGWSQGIMFRTTSGYLYALGNCAHGQFGTGNQIENFTTPTLLRTDVSELFPPCASPYSDSDSSTVFIKLTNGKIYSAGFGDFYQLGRHDMTTGAYDFGEVAFPDEGFEGVKHIFSASTTATGVSILAVTNNNRIFGWGYNGHHSLYYPNWGTHIKYPFLLDAKLK